MLSIASATIGCWGTSTEGNLEIRTAPIHDVQVNVAESQPPQVYIFIRGGLADSCTKFHDITMERKGNTINIKVTTERPRGEQCAQVYGYFDKNLKLENIFVSGETYIFKVNDNVTTVIMP
jgi:inhibitor of cysteine peptidase